MSAKRIILAGCGKTSDHQSGKVLAYVLGRRKDKVFLELKALLETFGITRFYTDGWGAYERHLEASKHEVGKHHMQKIESKHTNLRARIKRLARKTICFSKTELMHDLVIGLFINRYEFELPILVLADFVVYWIPGLCPFMEEAINKLCNQLS